MIIDRRKFTTKWSSLTVGSNSKSFLLSVHPAQETYAKVFCYITAYHNYITMYDDGLSGRGLMTLLGEVKDWSFTKITVFPVILLNDLFPLSSSRYCADRSTMDNWHVIATQRWHYSNRVSNCSGAYFWRYAQVRLTGIFFMLQSACTDVEMCRSFNLKKTFTSDLMFYCVNS